jgi:tripartite-type tricarboxylate transporter receptor subunit TctC
LKTSGVRHPVGWAKAQDRIPSVSVAARAFAHATALCKRILPTCGQGAAPFDWRQPTLVPRPCPPYRRGSVPLLAAAALAALPAPSCAQDYPTRPVEIIVPFAAGGGSELLARLVGDGLARRLGQPFVVVNRPGANTNLGTLAAVRAKPDGYTLLIASVGLAANPSLYKKLAFAPQADLAPITLIANSPTVLAVPPSLPVNSLSEFIAYTKARPGELNYASYGIGSGPHLATELFQGMTGVKMVHVPYGGGGPAAVGALTGQVQALFSSVLPVLGMIRGGTLKALAIASERRSELLPDVPTFAEGGLDYRTGTWFGLLAPAKTSPEIIGALHRATVAVLSEPGVHAKLTEQGAEMIANSPEEFRAFIKAETERLSGVIRASNIALD